MGDGLRTIRLVTGDEALYATARAAVSSLEGYELSLAPTADDLLKHPPAAGDVILLDAQQSRQNVYELCRKLAGQTRCRTFVVVDEDNKLADPIALFCGASGTLSRPLSAQKLRAVLAQVPTRNALPREHRDEVRMPQLPARLLEDLMGTSSSPLVAALSDPETQLYNYEFLTFKLDEEFKRAKRFGMPLTCVMLGFEGQAARDTLNTLGGIFLGAARDTDILGRFDESSFLFLLTNTGPDGASVMARRISTMVAERRLKDLVGDPLQLSVGIATYPHPAVHKREDMYARAREAYFKARSDGGGLVLAR